MHSSSTLAALWEQPRPLSRRVTSPYPVALTRLDSAWVTAQPQGQGRVHQAPWQTGRLSQSPSAAHRLFCRLWTWVCFCLGTKQRVCSSVDWALQALENRWVCRAHLAAHAPQQRHPGLWKASFCLEEGQNLDLFQDTEHLHYTAEGVFLPQLFAARAIPNIAQCLRISEANHKYISYSHL